MSSDESFIPSWPLAGVVFCLGAYFARRYFKGAQFTQRVSAKGKVALITGANSGIGFQTARELNLRGASVYMLCRNEQRAVSAKALLTKAGCDPTRLFIRTVNLADFSTIRAFAADISKEVDSVDILVNNAGIMFYPKFELTVDGHEMTWQSNYLGHFLLTELMLPLLRKSSEGRIVNVSSRLHLRADTVDASVVDDKKYFNRFMPYNRSKLANVMHARELTRRLRLLDASCTVTANSMHPGVVFTNLMQYTVFNVYPLRQILTPFFWFFLKTDKDGAQTCLYLALSKDVQAVSGKHFGECKMTQPSPLALDDHACNVLYNYSIEAVGLGK